MGYAYDESPFVPFNTPQVGPTVPSIPAPDMRDAEIAKLRAERDAIIIRCKDDTAPFLAEIASLERLRDELRSALDAALDALEAAAAEGGGA